MNVISGETAQIGLLSILFLIVGTDNLIGIHKIQLKQEIDNPFGVCRGLNPKKTLRKEKQKLNTTVINII